MLFVRQTPDMRHEMSKNDLAELILMLIAEQHEGARSQREPAAWRKWDHERWQIDREDGPVFSSIRWFGKLADSEAARVRCLRTVYRLHDAGLVEIIKGESGSKIERVKLAELGWEVVNRLRSGSKTLHEAAEDALDGEERASVASGWGLASVEERPLD
jgi:hypothetical protein